MTHRISPNVDAERDLLVDALVATKIATTLYKVSGMGPTPNGRNGEGDRYQTDGEIHFAVLSPGLVPVASAPKVIADPPLIDTKNNVWKSVSGFLAPASAD